MQGGADLIIGRGAEWHEYYLDQGQQPNLVHTTEKVNVPMNASGGTPTQAGGVYDVRDTEGDKSITHLDWMLGAGQQSLDNEKASASRFHSSKGFDIHKDGQLSLLRAKTDTHRVNVTGPVFSAMGKLWMGHASPTSTGLLKYSSDGGASWSDATINGTLPTSTITDFTTDGKHVYFCVPSGAETGVWRNNVDSGGVTVDDPANFRKLSTAGSANRIFKIAYQSGIIFCSTTSNAGLLKVTDNSYDVVTPSFLNADNTVVGLCAAGNAVYWVVSQGSQTFVYEIAYDPDLQTATTKQLSELTGGFIATCAVGYLGNVYVGGYFESSDSSVGRGAVFICNSDTGETQPLVEIGDYPEDTTNIAAVSNDNRVYAMWPSVRDLYILCNFACYRWDLDNGGYSHVFDHIGSGASGLTTSYNAGSSYSWDGTNQYLISVHPSPFPSGWEVDGDATPDVATHWTPYWTETGGIATRIGTGSQVWIGSPTGGEALSNSTGTTIHYKAAAGRPSTGSVDIFIEDGTKKAVFSVLQSTIYLYRYGWREHYGYFEWWDEEERQWFSDTRWHAHENEQVWSFETQPTDYRIAAPFSTLTYTNGSGATDLYFHLHGNSAEVWDLNKNTILSTSYISTTANSKLTIDWDAGTNCDLLELNSQGFVASAQSSEYLFHPSITFHKGSPYAAYSDPTGEKSLTISDLDTSTNVARITTSAAHLLESGQVVYISGTTSTPAINGLAVVSNVVDSDTFDIAVSGGLSVHSTHAGNVKYNHSVGWTKLGTTVCESAWLKTSRSSFHSGSMLKSFKYIEVFHDALPTNASISAAYTIDGQSGSVAASASTTTTTKIPISAEGYSIDVTLEVTADDAYGNLRINGFNVIWDFVGAHKHTYMLDCRPGVANGRWKENPEDAIAFILDNANAEVLCEDRYAGLYSGVIETVEFSQSPRSLTESPNGKVKIVVREVQ